MKKIFSILAAVLMSASVYAQPNQMSYQAVIRDVNNNLLANKSIGMRVSILHSTGGNPKVLYQETYSNNPQTNANGLLSIIIGGGTPGIGTFSSINWTNGGTYYIQTEADPTGGTNYTITGSNPLLSVPYALNAKKADSVKYSIPIKAGNNIMVTGSGTSASPYIINDSIHKIGDSYGGGIVFYVYDNGRHGLIAAISDQATQTEWWNGTNKITGAYSDGLCSGALNTAIIIATEISDNQTGNFAALYCVKYSVTVKGVNYGNWYLPSKYELNLMYLNIGQGAAAPYKNIGGFTVGYYWSSTEYSSNSAWEQDFSNGNQSFESKDNPLPGNNVRAIRAF